MPTNPQFAPTKRTESEWQLLEDIAKNLPRGATGRVDLQPNGSPAPTARMISQFEHAYPGVKVNVSWG